MGGTGLASIGFSLSGLASILLVWVAGSHRFGVISRVWQTSGIIPLLLVSALAFGLSALTLPRDRARVTRLIPVMVLAAALLPFIAFLLVLAARFYHGAG